MSRPVAVSLVACILIFVVFDKSDLDLVREVKGMRCGSLQLQNALGIEV